MIFINKISDASQSTGITNLNFPNFDKISFDWNGKYGAKIYVRFKCLSTDFSRIKGVKGIPLRTQMETHIAADVATGVSELDEICFCKVKLFRDKGAERKNKDDAKQISKQLEKVYGKLIYTILFTSLLISLTQERQMNNPCP